MSKNRHYRTWLRYSYIQHLASIWLLAHKLSSNRKLFVSYQPAKQKNFLLLHTNLLSRKTSFVHARAVSTLLFSAATFDDLYCWYKKSHSSSPPSDIPVQYTVLFKSWSILSIQNEYTTGCGGNEIRLIAWKFKYHKRLNIHC